MHDAHLMLAVAEGAPHPAAAAAFVRYLGSEPGQRAFAACGVRQP